MIRDEHLIRVTNESELRAGMTVVNKDCDRCGTHARILVRRERGGRCAACFDRNGWIVVGGCPVGNPDGVCFCGPIARHKLYRLRDDVVAENEEQITVVVNTRQTIS